LCPGARGAARGVLTDSTDTKTRCLSDGAARLREQRPRLLEVNAEDVQRGERGGLSAALLDRLTLTAARIDAIAAGLDEVARLPDPVGETVAPWRRPNGLKIGQARVPLCGVGGLYGPRPPLTP